MSRFAYITEDPDYDMEFDDDLTEDELEEFDEVQSERVFARLVEELSPFSTVNS